MQSDESEDSDDSDDEPENGPDGANALTVEGAGNDGTTEHEVRPSTSGVTSGNAPKNQNKPASSSSAKKGAAKRERQLNAVDAHERERTEAMKDMAEIVKGALEKKGTEAPPSPHAAWLAVIDERLRMMTLHVSMLQLIKNIVA